MLWVCFRDCRSNGRGAIGFSSQWPRPPSREGGAILLARRLPTTTAAFTCSGDVSKKSNWLCNCWTTNIAADAVGSGAALALCMSARGCDRAGALSLFFVSCRHQLQRPRRGPATRTRQPLMSKCKFRIMGSFCLVRKRGRCGRALCSFTSTCSGAASQCCHRPNIR